MPAAGRLGEGEVVTWVSASVFEEKARALAGLTKGAEVYVKGRLSPNTWTGRTEQAHGVGGEAPGPIGRRKQGAARPRLERTAHRQLV